MYLKSIEVQGFKSFANRILFEFHNGITGIVGPNGSGKSNVADAVRWVLGEQSARTLRGLSMQDVIFSGTEARKPLSYAYVAITMDNSDHTLPVEYEEVTIARRVYRSGESEYLLNGQECRLKDVTEMLYDTGIGKEGYSIIGQGQIDRILSGKPEDRRELFDEAAGIVKYKRRKAAAEKKLENEKDYLVRINDILNELEGRVAPLKRQSDTAKIYLSKKEELKKADINRFLVEMEEAEKVLSKLEKDAGTVESDLSNTKEELERIHREYEETDRIIKDLEEARESTQEEISSSEVSEQKLSGEIGLLQEQIHTAETSMEHFAQRKASIREAADEKQKQKDQYLQELEKLKAELSEMEKKRMEAEEELKVIRKEADRCQEEIEKGQNEIIQILNTRSEILAKKERSETMQEQTNLKRAEFSGKLLRQKTLSEEKEQEYREKEKLEQEAVRFVTECRKKLEEAEAEEKKLSEALRQETEKLSQMREAYQKEKSRFEALQNLAERYEGYGHSVRAVMEEKKRFPKMRGAVADLIRVEKKYETAVETALGGNIQNIVTEDEKTAKEAIRFLKERKAGRVTFLPMESVKGRDMKQQEHFLSEEGVIGFASNLVKADPSYDGIIGFLLGRVFAVDTVEHALALAKKSGYSLHIVTLEGEYLSPGGSIAGGAFKNNSNLLGRRRELDELKSLLAKKEKELSEEERKIEELKTARTLRREECEEKRTAAQEAAIAENTAQLNKTRAKEQWDSEENALKKLSSERSELEEGMKKIREELGGIEEELKNSVDTEESIKKKNEELKKEQDKQIYMEEGANRRTNELLMEESSCRQKTDFSGQNLSRVESEIKELSEEEAQLKKQMDSAEEDAKKKAERIEEIKTLLQKTKEKRESLKKKLAEVQAKKAEVQEKNKDFFARRNTLTDKMNGLDKELYRLRSQEERQKADKESLTNYIWNEYELTLHNAGHFRDESLGGLKELRQRAFSLRDEIRRMGEVNVNAIEEYREVSERYETLKKQHDDLVQSEEELLRIIEDLESGMKQQFEEQFAVVQREFEAAFKELFGGGKASLALSEPEDLLNSGILINAQPPGKKLQNMMQLSGGEKALTAIALLFGIQNMKPSPFCLLDEIEAALDDSNVGRFAHYLNKLTKNTQFIIITHRRGTMTAADRLYGITMQEKGVSTLVSVDLIEEKLS